MFKLTMSGPGLHPLQVVNPRKGKAIGIAYFNLRDDQDNCEAGHMRDFETAARYLNHSFDTYSEPHSSTVKLASGFKMTLSNDPADVYH